MKTIAITGAGGYVGCIAVQYFLARRYRIVAIDSYITGFREPLLYLSRQVTSGTLRIVECDIRSPALATHLSGQNIETVIHCAARCAIDDSLFHPFEYFDANVFGTTNVLESMVKLRIRNIVFPSTAAVYGEPHSLPITETHPFHPENPYGQSKHMAERTINWYEQCHGIRYVILRCFNITGASKDGSLGDAKIPGILVLHNAVRAALTNEMFYETFSPVHTPDKSPIRDFVHVVDVVNAFEQSMKYLENANTSRILNIGSGKGYSVNTILSLVRQQTGRSISISRERPRRGECAEIIASVAKAKKIIGWKPEMDIRSIIDSLIRWYTSHPYGWDKRSR